MNWITDNKEFLESMNIPTDRLAISQLLARHPWFTSARIVMDTEDNSPDKLLGIYMLTNPVPFTHLKTISKENIKAIMPVAAITTSNSGEEDFKADDIIEKFLREGEHRIIPSDDIGNHDASSESSVLELGDGMVTEELAEIYKSQGLNDKAEEIYRILEKNK